MTGPTKFSVVAYGQGNDRVPASTETNTVSITGLKPYTNYMVEVKLDGADLPPLQGYGRTNPGRKSLF